MADIAEAFETHLRSLPDEDWDALVARVRTPKPDETPGRSGKAEAARRASKSGVVRR